MSVSMIVLFLYITCLSIGCSTDEVSQTSTAQQEASSDETAIRTMQENKPPFVPFEAVCVLTSFRREHWMLTAPQPSVPTSHYHLCRLALTHLGYCRFDKTSAFCILENSARFHRSLAQLDKTSGYTPRRRLCLADFSLQTFSVRCHHRLCSTHPGPRVRRSRPGLRRE